MKFIIPSRLKSFFLCLASAFCLILSFPDFNLWIFAWLGFLPLFLALEGKTKLKAFFLAYFTGLIFWAGVIYWLIHVTLPGTGILILYLALYFGFFGMIFSFSRASTPGYLLFIPSIWVLLEYLRSYLFSGFPWVLLGYSQYLNLPVIQIADITGVWGVSFLIMLVNVACYSLVRRSEFRVQSLKLYILPVFCLIISLGYGYYQIYRTPSSEQRTPIRLSVIQPNIPQDLKWDPAAKDFIFREYSSLTQDAARDNPALVIWPEASSPEVVGEDSGYFEKVKTLMRSLRVPLLFGAVTSQSGSYYNSALLLNSKGEVAFRYNKLHLVPFGEYIPLKNIFGFLKTVVPIGEMSAGKDYTIFKLGLAHFRPQPNFAVLICFEDAFPELSREFKKRGVDFLVTITNDAWYKKTSAARQHLQASVFRAVENHSFLARAANTGVSAFIEPSGRIISALQDTRGNMIFIKGYRTENLVFSDEGATIYTQWGDSLIFFCITIVLYAIIGAFIKSKMKKTLLLLLIALAVFSTAGFYFSDKTRFLCPIEYQGGFLVRCDNHGSGFFASSRNGNRKHEGIDLSASIGTPVLAAKFGRVIAARYSRGMGNFVILRHFGGTTTLYGHLLRIYVKKGQFVLQGQPIGETGKTGNANYADIQPHLHFEVRKNGVPQDPLQYLQ